MSPSETSPPPGTPMTPAGHLPGLEPCPFLPRQTRPLNATSVSRLGAERGPDFYLAALHYAQSLWLQGFPARSILLLNRALGAEIKHSDRLLQVWPLPYAAIAWLLKNHQPDQFIGNPRRHWQHLATRMSGPRAELRTWRAWACWRMACVALPEMPADEAQLLAENLQEPGEEEIASHLDRLGHPGETGIWRDVLESLGSS